ncbi:MAG: hypothetical protein C4534_02105 [Gaiellales bacterium]|nr:MAG: hypothetical protein C4534_02105 [Gaiellales bacterium]
MGDGLGVLVGATVGTAMGVLVGLGITVGLGTLVGKATRRRGVTEATTGLFVTIRTPCGWRLMVATARQPKSNRIRLPMSNSSFPGVSHWDGCMAIPFFPPSVRTTDGTDQARDSDARASAIRSRPPSG